MGKTRINHSQFHHVCRWYVYHSQSWVVYGIVLPSLWFYGNIHFCWLNHHVPMVFLWFSYGFPMVFLSIYESIIHPTVQQIQVIYLLHRHLPSTVSGPSTAFQQHRLTLRPCGHVGTAQHVQQLRTPWGTRWSKGLACWRWWIASQGTDLGPPRPCKYLEKMDLTYLTYSIY